MILINSIDRDISTDEVLKWLLKFKAEFIRLNNISEINEIHYINNHFSVSFDNRELISLENLKAYWYRRGDLNYHVEIPKHDNSSFNQSYGNYIREEYKSIKDFFIYYLKNNVYCIGDSVSCTNVNKHNILLKARECNLKTPNFIITSEKAHLINFLKKHENVITKPLNSPLQFSSNNYWYPSYTESLNKRDLNKIPSSFEPTLFQDQILKKFEIRTFFLDDEFYSMAIFSQNDPQTRIDFRVYNDDKPNRNVPFNLPKNIEEKLRKLFKELHYESGSVDLLYSPEKDFIFLEINPIGQFGMVSKPCNYGLEKIIAQKLSAQ